MLPRGRFVCHYAPLNPAFSDAEFTAHLTRLRPRAVIVPERSFEGVRDCATALGIDIIDLVSRVTDPAGTFSLVRQGDSLVPPRNPEWNTADDYALVLLTSGSTVEPKAVPLRVRHLLAYARASGEHYGLGPTDRCLHVMPMFHGHGLKSSLFVPLVNGSGVIISPDFDVATFFQQMKALRPTSYWLRRRSTRPSMDGSTRSATAWARGSRLTTWDPRMR